MRNDEPIAAVPDEKMVRVSAAEQLGSDLTHVEGIAYSGGTFHQWWSDAPCVTDLAGLEIAPQVPLMYNHYYDPEFRLGEIAVSKTEAALLISGGIDPESDRGKAIISAGKKCQWQLSHGAEILASKFIEKGEKCTANGREFEGPIRLITKAVLREVSVVAIGADADTSLRIAAGFNMTHANKLSEKEGGQMEKREDKVEAAIPAKAETGAPEVKASEGKPVDVKAAAEAAVKAERERVTAVRAALKDCPAIVNKAIDEGWTEEYCKTVAAGIKDAMTGITASGANIIVKNKPETSGAVLEAALELRAGIDEDAVLASHGEQVIEAADRMRGISLKETLAAACELKGVHVGTTMGSSDIRAGFSTTDLPVILGNVANKAMLKEFQAVPVVATQICATGDLADYKEAQRVRLTDLGDLEEVPAGSEIANSRMTEEVATNQAKRYAKLFWLDEQLVVNDDLGTFLKIPRAFGARAARKIDQVFFARLLSNPTMEDGNALFSSAHGNYKTGSDGALSLNALKALRKLFLQQTDANGDPIAIAPKFLLVPSALEAEAQELVASQLVVSGNTTARGNVNIVSKWGLQVIGSPYLDNAKYTNNSATGWYLFADPAMIDTFEVGFLKGRRFPTVEQGVFDFNHFGVGYRVRYDFGVREQDYRGMTFATGVSA